MKSFHWKFGLLACTAAVATNASAGPTPEPLDLDPSFAGDGTRIIELGQHDYAFEGLLEPSGEIVVFGYSDNGSPSNGEAIFQRIQADGTPGTLSRFDAAAFGCSVPRAFRAGLRLSNGDYLGGGYVQEGCSGVPRHFNALQLTSSGQLVEEFDLAIFNNQLAYIEALGEQSDGAIIAVGFASGSGFDNTTYDIAVARFTPNGLLDPTFGSGGFFTFDRANDLDWSNDVVIDSADRILIAGYTRSVLGDQDMTVLRLTPDGVLDPTFNGTGELFFGSAGVDESATSIDLAPGGQILVGGVRRQSATVREAVVWALRPDGTLDPVFGNGGIATVDFGSDNAAITDLTYAAWRIYVTGFSRLAGPDRVDSDAVVSVLRLNGAPNPLFSSGTSRSFIFEPSLGTQADFPQSIAVSESGEQIVVTGYTDNADQTIQRFGIARLIGLENALFIDGFEGGEP